MLENQNISISSSVSARSLFLLAGGFTTCEIKLKCFNWWKVITFNSSADLASIAEITNLSLLNVKYDIDNINTGFVTLVGEFKNPGIYQIDSTTRLLDISKSGWVNKYCISSWWYSI